MRRPLVATLAFLTLVAAAPVREAPRYRHERDGTLVVMALPDVLAREEVRPHLTTGLTTSFVVRAVVTPEHGRAQEGAARIDVRWEPWDEVFYVSVLAVDGRARRDTVPSLERLHAWWQAQELPVMRGVPGPLDRVRIEVSVVPFSQSEERDTQRWFASTGQPAEEPAARGAARDGASRIGSAIDLLMATSIQRRSIVRFAWEAVPVGPS